MAETAFAAEVDLQELLAQYPGLLPGDQIDPESPRRWLLVAREVSVPDDTGSRWALDHLFLDRDGVPTLVEVKRGGDSRIRREVVGQLLDYAAHSSSTGPRRRFAPASRNAAGGMGSIRTKRSSASSGETSRRATSRSG